MNLGILWCVAAAVAMCSAEKWQWPEHEQASSVRIDTKVRFTDQHDTDNSEHQGRLRDEEVPFHEAAETDGFYNRPPGAGRFPVRVETHPYRVDQHSIYSMNNLGKNYNSDGTLDSLQYCKCVSTPDCNQQRDSRHACGEGKFLCCYKRQNKATSPNSEYFNEIGDERLSLLAGNGKQARPFPPPPGTEDLGPAYLIPRIENQHDAGRVNVPVLVGPAGGSDKSPGVLVGPEGPTGVIGPGLPNHNGPRDVGPSESAQRGILVGPGGPTGVIGPRGYGQRPVLVGPGGPTGFIGPRMRGFFNQYFEQPRQGVLTGPGGPTGMIGPPRQVLVGPGGPTGRIGPQNYFG